MVGRHDCTVEPSARIASTRLVQVMLVYQARPPCTSLEGESSSQNSSVTYSQAPPSLLSLPTPRPANNWFTISIPRNFDREQAMAASRRHAQLVLLLLLDLCLFCTFAKCTVLTFERTDNSITLRCVTDLQNQFPVPNANFFVRASDTNRHPVQDFTRGQSSNEIMFTLTPETERNFSCQNPTTNEFSEELLLAGELP